MRVLHIGKFYPPAPGGIESYVCDLARGLAGLEDRVESIVAVHRLRPDEPARQTDRPGVTVVRVPTYGQISYAPVAPGFPVTLRRLVREFRPDLLHVHVPNTAAFWPLLTGIRLPLVTHWHADVILPPGQPVGGAVYGLYRRFERALLRRSDAVIATSEPYLNASPLLAGVREKCRVVPLGADPARLYRPSPDEIAETRKRYLGDSDSCLFLSAGRFSHYKGFRHLVEAVSLFQDARLVMVGDGEEVDAVRNMVRSLGLASRITLAGRLSDSDLHTLMAAADVFCLPSVERTEAFGIVLLEAMHAATPCISTAIPGSGTGWVNAHGETGLVVPPGDVKALAGAMRELAEDRERRMRMGGAARERFDSLFRSRVSAEGVKRVYEDVLRSR